MPQAPEPRLRLSPRGNPRALRKAVSASLLLPLGFFSAFGNILWAHLAI